jgi:hypothetical protein
VHILQRKEERVFIIYFYLDNVSKKFVLLFEKTLEEKGKWEALKSWSKENEIRKEYHYLPMFV